MDELTAGTIAEVQARVGEDAELAARALTEEQAKGDDARSTLVEWLERVINPPADDEPDEEQDEELDAVGPERFVAEDADRPGDVSESEAGKLGPERFVIE